MFANVKYLEQPKGDEPESVEQPDNNDALSSGLNIL